MNRAGWAIVLALAAGWAMGAVLFALVAAPNSQAIWWFIVPAAVVAWFAAYEVDTWRDR